MSKKRIYVVSTLILCFLLVFVGCNRAPSSENEKGTHDSDTATTPDKASSPTPTPVTGTVSAYYAEAFSGKLNATSSDNISVQVITSRTDLQALLASDDCYGYRVSPSGTETIKIDFSEFSNQYGDHFFQNNQLLIISLCDPSVITVHQVKGVSVADVNGEQKVVVDMETTPGLDSAIGYSTIFVEICGDVVIDSNDDVVVKQTVNSPQN